MSEFAGLEWTPQLEKAIHQDHLKEIARFRSEDTIRKLRGDKPLSSLHGSMIESTVVAVLKSRVDPQIIGVGKNCVDDLWVDNWGHFMASMIQGPSLGALGYPIKCTNGSVYLTEANYGSYSGQYGGWWNYCGGESSVICGMQFQFGSGNTAAARGDYTIQTPFLTAPESQPFDCGVGSYANGYITIANSIAAGGSGTANEIGFIMKGYRGNKLWMVSHDIITPIGFAAGNVLLASCVIAI